MRSAVASPMRLDTPGELTEDRGRMRTTAEKRREFRRLHERGCFVLPNPWDVGTTRYLQSLGFKALATTSAGFAFSRGRPDGGIDRDDMLAHVAELSAAADVPVNADFEGGYAVTPEGVAESVRLCCDTGVAGLSIEDATGDVARPLHDLELAVARVAAARRAIDDAGGDVVLTARTEGFIRGRPDLAETIRRLRAFAAVGADCLYAPGITTRDQIRAVVDAVSPAPVNVVIGWASDLTVGELEALGVRRISVGGALARAAWHGVIQAARSIAETGSFAGFAGVPATADLNRMFEDDARRR
jgi:2-methylisocitrate lyase-like PEP mutase family enzyme